MHFGDFYAKNGRIVKTIEFAVIPGVRVDVWRSTDLVEPLTPALVRALRTGLIYVSVYTSQLPGGEIRGQLYPLFVKSSN